MQGLSIYLVFLLFTHSSCLGIFLLVRLRRLGKQLLRVSSEIDKGLVAHCRSFFSSFLTTTIGGILTLHRVLLTILFLCTWIQIEYYSRSCSTSCSIRFLGSFNLKSTIFRASKSSLYLRLLIGNINCIIVVVGFVLRLRDLGIWYLWETSIIIGGSVAADGSTTWWYQMKRCLWSRLGAWRC